jgi:hypothetical protein
MYKQIIIVVLLFFHSMIYCQEMQKKRIVYSNSKEIGFLNQETDLSQCEECYILDSLKIFKSYIVVKTEVILLGLNSDGKTINHFSNLYDVELKKENSCYEIIFNNKLNSFSRTTYIKIINNQMILYKTLSHYNSSTDIKIAEGEYESFPSTKICIQNLNLSINNHFLDFNSLPKSNEYRDCFDCPIKYNISECLKKRKKKEKFKWN